jgi:tetratricopeptide (TPR) repeat protein
VSLRHLGIILSELGRHEEALAANLEALEIQRVLPMQAPLDLSQGLASDLVNAAGRLREQGRVDEALSLMKQAIEIRKELAAEQPETFLPALASAHHNYGIVLANAGRLEEALAATEEGVRLQRQLARDRPEVFAPLLARMEELFEAAEAGLRLLLPHLAPHWDALNGEAASLLGYYLDSSAATGRPRDPEIARGISEARASSDGWHGA